MLGPGAPRIVRAGLPDRGALLVAEGLPCAVIGRARPVRPARRRCPRGTGSTLNWFQLHTIGVSTIPGTTVPRESVTWLTGSRSLMRTRCPIQSPKRTEPVMPVPDQTRDRWSSRAEPDSGTGAIYWHVLFGDDPAARATARAAQARLASFRDLHMTPGEWLHATALVAGTTDDISSEDLELMLSGAQRHLHGIQPIKVTIARVLYHPEAIMLGFTPEGALDPIHRAVRQATLAVTGQAGSVTGPAARWTPHMTISYSTGTQPMAPIAAALGREVPRCDITVRAVSLVIQWGPERLWNWQPVGTASLSTS